MTCLTITDYLFALYLSGSRSIRRNKMKTKVAMMFGGKTVEHEVSVISGIQAIKSMDTDKYEVVPV